MKDYSAARRQLEQSLASEFEVDYEIRMALFLTANIDGLAEWREKAFLSEVGRQLEWSSLYQNLLQTKIEKQPSYTLDALKLTRGNGELAKVVYQLALGIALADGNLTVDERMLLTNMRDTLFLQNKNIAYQLEGQIKRLYGREKSDLLITAAPTGGAKKESPTITPELKTRSDHSGKSKQRIQDSDDSDSFPEEKEETAEDCLKVLDEMIGLTAVKKEIHTLVSYLSIQKKRKEMNLSLTKLSLHMVFTGNPGTGKTTVARLVARILKALGFLAKGHLVETDRSGLVGQYIGHTAIKTSEKIDEALDGILFIDEAYAITQGSKNDFGQEAIDTLVKRMEDYRDRIVIIVAGYHQEMNNFINSNPGLRSRFNTFIDFINYTPQELIRIFEILCDANDYAISETGKTQLKKIFAAELAHRGRHFSNGRLARNLFEKAVRIQALRLTERKSDLTREDLITLTEKDILFDEIQTIDSFG